MSGNEKVVTFESFAKKAAMKMEERKKRKTATLYVGDLDENIVVRGLTDQEFLDCSEYSDSGVETDKYTMYFASPTLQEAAKYMVDNGMIKDHMEICNCISSVDRGAICKKIMDISGINDASTVKEVETVKN